MSDKYSAVWVSHTSIKDFLECPRAYFLKNIYKDPKTGHKVKIMSPPLALGQVVHEVVESLSVLPRDKRFETPLIEKFEAAWKKISGKRGGFRNIDIENNYKQRGTQMLKRISSNPGPLKKLAVKIKMDLPNYWLSEEDNIILCGKIDWLEYIPEQDGVHIIDFKTGKNEEDDNSLQLPIYSLLVHNCQNRKAIKASYWYLEQSSELTSCPLPDLNDAYNKVLRVAKQIKLARQLEKFKCPHGGCQACKPYELLLDGKGEFVGQDEYKQDVYVLFNEEKKENSEIL